MVKRVAFLHRNSFHDILFVEVGKVLRQKYNLDIMHVRNLGSINGENVFQFENLIEKKWNNIDISYLNLSNLEKEYPCCDFMRTLYSEREYSYFPKYYRLKPVSYEEQLKYLVGCFLVFEELLEQNNIDCFFSELITGLPDGVLYAICKKRGIQYISLRSSKLLPGIIICDQDFDLPTGMLDVYKSFLQSGIPAEYHDLAKSHINDLKSKIMMPNYMRVTGKKYKLMNSKRLLNSISVLRAGKNRINSISTLKHPFRTPVFWNIFRFINIWHTRKNKSRWFCEKLPPEEKYFVYPLHYEPEASTFIRAFPFTDQMHVIQQIAKALPLGITLIVKEHRGNQGYRKSGFYRELQYLPNVRLVPPEMENNYLVSNSIGIITLTGRMGWESLVLGKPVIALGSTFWTFFEEVKKPRSWIELKSMIEDCVTSTGHNKEFNYNNNLQAYAAAYISLTREGNYVPKSDGSLDESNFENIATALYLAACGFIHA